MDGRWVFGAIERESGRCLMTEVPDRRRETVEPIIRRWIMAGVPRPAESVGLWGVRSFVHQ